MPLNEIPKYLDPDTRHLVEKALEEAWRELNESDAAKPRLSRPGSDERY